MSGDTRFCEYKLKQLKKENAQLREDLATRNQHIEIALLRRMATKGMTVDFSLNGGWEDLHLTENFDGRYEIDTIASGSTLKKLLKYVEG